MRRFLSRDDPCADVARCMALTPGAAQAGGSWIEFDGPLIVGTLVTGSGTFGDGQQEASEPARGSPPCVRRQPGSSPIALGPVEISRASSFGWRATVTFVVPEVPTGEYWVDIANDDREGVGDLDRWVRRDLQHAPRRPTLVAGRPQRRRRGRAPTDAADRLRHRQGQLEETLSDRQATIERQAERLTAAGARITASGIRPRRSDSVDLDVAVLARRSDRRGAGFRRVLCWDAATRPERW